MRKQNTKISTKAHKPKAEFKKKKKKKRLFVLKKNKKKTKKKIIKKPLGLNLLFKEFS